MTLTPTLLLLLLLAAWINVSYSWHVGKHLQRPTQLQGLYMSGFGKKTADSFKKKKPTKNFEDEFALSSKQLQRQPTVKEILQNYCPSIDLTREDVNILCNDPPILEVKNFFNEQLCDDMIARAQDIGVKYGSQTFSAATAAQRTSTTWYLHYKDVPEFLHYGHQLTGIRIENYEEPQIVRYEFGQQFSWHYDSLPPSSKQLLLNGGQRLATLLIYLNDVKSGGATCFKDLNLQVRPEKGKALLFFPCDQNGIPDDRTMHAGQVAMDTKWIAQMLVAPLMLVICSVFYSFCC